MTDQPAHITPLELHAAVSRARAASLDGSIDMTAALDRLRDETGRGVQATPSVPIDDPSIPGAARVAASRMAARSVARLHALIEAGEQRTA